MKHVIVGFLHISVTSFNHRVVASITAASQQDLTIKDLSLSRYTSPSSVSTSNSPAPVDESVDMATRGRELAVKCWDEDESFLAKDRIAEWLGGT